MKNKIQSIVILTFLMANNAFFAQGPNPDDAGDGVNPTDAPIDANLFLLVLVALLFAYFAFSKKLVSSGK